VVIARDETVPGNLLSCVRVPFVRDTTRLPNGTAILPLPRPDEKRILVDVAFAGPDGIALHARVGDAGSAVAILNLVNLVP